MCYNIVRNMLLEIRHIEICNYNKCWADFPVAREDLITYWYILCENLGNGGPITTMSCVTQHVKLIRAVFKHIFIVSFLKISPIFFIACTPNFVWDCLLPPGIVPTFTRRLSQGITDLENSKFTLINTIITVTCDYCKQGNYKLEGWGRERAR